MSTTLPLTMPATLDDLLRVEGKAELIDGRIVRFMSSGYDPVRAAFMIAISLEAWSKQIGKGVVFTDGIGFAIRPPLRSKRQSFSPDASYYTGPTPQQRMKFVEGAPDFAVEVRSEGDYGPLAERQMADKRNDYFEAGTFVVWDVNPEAREIRSYRAASPTQSVLFKAGDTADAEPAAPGWRIRVDEVFG
jgi:Uma2 family endonuclease